MPELIELLAKFGVPAGMLVWASKWFLPKMFAFFRDELNTERARCDTQAALDREMYRASLQQLTRHIDDKVELLREAIGKS